MAPGGSCKRHRWGEAGGRDVLKPLSNPQLFIKTVRMASSNDDYIGNHQDEFLYNCKPRLIAIILLSYLILSEILPVAERQSGKDLSDEMLHGWQSFLNFAKGQGWIYR